MKDQERLEKLKNGSVFDNDDINFLLKQAGRVQELETRAENALNHKLTYRYVARRYQKERNRYKQALERARTMLNEMSGTVEVPMHPTVEGAYKVFEVLNNALKGESE